MANKRFDSSPKFIVHSDAVVIQQAAGSTAPLLQLKDHTGSSLMTVNASGQMSSASPTFTGTVTLPSTTSIGTVSSTEIGYLDGVTSAIQTQIDTKAPTANPTFTGTVNASAISAASLTLSGNLTVNGTTTTLNSTTVSVDDINITLGDTASPTDATANGGGITLKGATDKTLTWQSSHGGWEFSHPTVFNTIAAQGRGVAVKGDSSGGAAIIQFLNNAVTAQWAAISATSGQLNLSATTGVDFYTDSLRIEKTVAGGNGPMLRLENKSDAAGTRAGIFFGVDSGSGSWADFANGEIIVENSGLGNTGIMRFRVYDGGLSEAMKICGNGLYYTAAENAGYNLRNGVAFANAGVAIDKGWNGYPGILVMNTNGYGDTRQQEFRFHGWDRSYSSYPASSGGDFGVNVRIDGSSYLTSDARVKTNIQDNPYGLAAIMQLQPRKFDRINSRGEVEEHISNVLGFIAQEVIGVIPEAVRHYEDEDVPNEIGWCRAYSLNESHILSTAVNAIKQQQQIIDSLVSRIEALEAA